MVNTHAKGKRNEREAQVLLEEEGYLTERKPSTKWNSDDFFELFDILAIKPKTGEVRLIQIKSNRSDFYKARKEIAKFIDETGMVISCECWLREPRKDWRKEKIKGNPSEPNAQKIDSP